MSITSTFSHITLTLSVALALPACVDQGVDPQSAHGADGKADGFATCAELQGMCLSSPMFPTTAPSCENDFGLINAEGSCESFAQSCCVVPEPALSCADEGGQCLNSSMFPTFSPSCENEFGLVTGEGSCAAFNQSCCLPRAEPEPEPEPQPQPQPSSCEIFGAQCLTSWWSSAAPSCEFEYGMTTAAIGSCNAVNESCCF